MKTLFPYSPVVAVGLLAALFLLEVGCQRQQQSEKTAGSNEKEAIVEQIVDSEELILALNTKLSALKKSALNLEIPDPLGRELFATQVEFSPWDFASSTSSEVRNTSNDQLTLWSAELEKISYFDHAKFYMIRGHFDETDPNRFQSDVGFYGLAKLKD